ncbi:hypothetical protein [Neptunomonas sp.]|uniref:hypothetical protein n=1 Tax=Neptunomonas sp. TaxID=1971898 RepID=UPI0035628748
MKRDGKKVQLIKKPVSSVTAFSESTAKDLLGIQTEYMLKQLNSFILRCRVLSEVEKGKATIENQLKYFEGASHQLSEITGDEIRLLKFYKNKLLDIVDRNMIKAPLMPVSCRVTDGEKISVGNVQNNEVHKRAPHNKNLNLHSEGALKSRTG